MQNDRCPFYIALLHEGMLDKQGTLVTTSLTMIDMHDIARSATTYAVDGTFIAHPSPALQELASTLQEHWQHGYGATYNEHRKEAISQLMIVNSLDDAIKNIEEKHSKKPVLVATSAHEGHERISFKDLQKKISSPEEPILLLLGTGWGMSEHLLRKTDLFLEPIRGVSDYNHLSVRSACAIMLDRLFAN